MSMQVALIGLGMVAQTHARAIAATNGKVSLRGVLSRSKESAEAFLTEASDIFPNAPKAYAGLQELVSDQDLDFVIVCTPPNARADIVSALADRGLPILMEKPIERTYQAAEEIVRRCETAAVPLGIVFQHRMRASAKQLKRVLKQGTLGQIAMVEISVPWWRAQSYYDEPGRGTYQRDGGGVLISQAIHTLDLALSLTGPIIEVQSMAAKTSLHDLEAEDFVSAGLRFDNGAVGSLVASTASFPGGAESITLHCQHGSAVLKSGQLELLMHDGSIDTFGEESATGGGADPMAFTHEWHQAVIEDMADAIVDKRAPICSGREALRVHRLIQALIQSATQKSAVAIPQLES
ncbi:putative oxidoreductase YdgJ [Labrenzia sp. THAF82]|uniref:Gfo/Idh/MocA family protein n=1 Tax=Labrenzia sp. THAF82 TaxID=2587861 RepID=UPI0012AA5F52|nr:Gfo/Idh/MocA family oxidoreductase [Labrenzia sp. THAF82]QFT30569.1 putative oxidoreductase YdgJ [Labrenzia sp. THAF82]